MRLRISALFVALNVCQIVIAAQTVVESESSVIIKDHITVIKLIVTSAKTVTAVPIEIAIVAPDETVSAQVYSQTNLAQGKRTYEFTLDASKITDGIDENLPWYRLRYRVGEAAGVVSLSELLNGDFELRAASFARVVPGQSMRVRVRAVDPFKEKGVVGVELKVELKIDLKSGSKYSNDELKVNAVGRTNGSGIATLDFRIPADIRPDENGALTIIGQKNGVVRKIENDLDDDSQNGTVLLTTDKPLYQPGQTFNLRAIYLDVNNTVVANSELEFTVEDEDDNTVFHKKVATSAFGVASISWPIPDNAPLGTYSVKVESQDDDLRENDLRFKVSRYDLANFTVSAQTDRSYYLPTDQAAKFTISGTYLFGKPVTQGKVRIVEETERHWNYKTQRYDADEGKSVEGVTDTEGKYVCQWDFKDAFDKLKTEEWERYKDISFAAYFTDSSTNRTEQRRFDVRLTKEPIHIYFIHYYRQHKDLPAIGYVSTFYADGTPAVCEVDVTDAAGKVARFKTNSMGAGKCETSVPDKRVDPNRYDVKVIARDKKGLLGTADETFSISADDSLQIRTDKIIYAQNEQVEVDLRSTQRSGYIYVDVVKDYMPVHSELVQLRNGRAHVTLPYEATFKGDLVIVAYTDREAGRWSDVMRSTRGIVFPEQQNLIVNAKFSKNQYRPNEDAALRFSVLDGQRNAIESVLGVSMIDKAVEERARTENEFGGYFKPFYSLMGYDHSFGALSLKDLNELDMSKPVSPEMQLAAEIMLAGGRYLPAVYHSGGVETEAKSLYQKSLENQQKPVEQALKDQYAQDFEYPTDSASLQRILLNKGIDLQAIRDSWGNNYFAEFSVSGDRDVITMQTMGPDEKQTTADDFTVLTVGFEYFKKTGEAIDRAVLQYHNATDNYISDLSTLIVETAKQGIDLTLRDKWGRSLGITFNVEGRYHVTQIKSAGPDGVFSTSRWPGDDVTLWTNSTDYFRDAEREINRILDLHVNAQKKPFPRSEAEFIDILRQNGLDLAAVKDGDGRPVSVAATLEWKSAPTAQGYYVFKIRGGGDRDMALFSLAITGAMAGASDYADITILPYSGAKGAISGTITDSVGAVIPNVPVKAIEDNDAPQTFSAMTNDEGYFLIANVPSGKYTVRVEATAGFSGRKVDNVIVESHRLTVLKIQLYVAGVSMTVDVAAGDSSAIDQTSNATSSSITRTAAGLNIAFPYKDQTSTPRVREYFPETLVWRPEVVTDKKGKAEMSFKMADSITTWKMFAIASTKKGKVGVVEKEVTAFQPFFADLDPPKFLTEGDEIFLPSQVRNYTNKKQKIDVTMDKASWFAMLSPDRQQIEVEQNGSTNAVFGFRAITPVKDGKQRIRAIAQTDSDAIEKPVTVRPNGQEIVRTDTRVTDGSAAFDVSFPSNALSGTQRAKLKIYPDLFAQVTDSVEGLLERPYGCGEQTISSTYPNLMILKFVNNDSPLRQRAKRYLQSGYERLLGYQDAVGGFSFWGDKNSTPDVALTAYAIRFLNDARSLIEVDQSVIERAEAWLRGQQRADGSWAKIYGHERIEDVSRTKAATAYVVRSLALRKETRNAESVQKGIAYLKSSKAADDAYSSALLGLAALDAEDSATAGEIAKRLERSAVKENDGVYWQPTSNTLFYGWGKAGSVETTALVLQLMMKTGDAVRKETISQALAFLFTNKDGFGVWHSTQATINVLDAFLIARAVTPQSQRGEIQISVNGRLIKTLPASEDENTLIMPAEIDITSGLSLTNDHIEVVANGHTLMTQFITTHYVAWVEAGVLRSSSEMKLDYRCDKPNAAIMEEISCTVEAARINGRYGMLLAEIGTPPGADVSRESLEKAIESDWSISRYDILPDRIIIYMWAKAGGTKFNFRFKPRYAIKAQTPASVIYDYYNPDAQATVAPIKFNVQAK